MTQRTTARWFEDGQVSVVDVDRVGELLARPDGWLWLDVPVIEEKTELLLLQQFRIHPRAVMNCMERNHLARTHVYPEHTLLITHSPEPAETGHVHYLELDQIVGERFLITTHGPTNPAVPLATTLRETEQVAVRVMNGRLRPSGPTALSHAISTVMVRTQELQVAELAKEVGDLERAVMSSQRVDPQGFLEELYSVRHQLLTVRTLAAQGEQVVGRLLRLSDGAAKPDRERLKDLIDQYRRVHHVGDSQLGFLEGVTEHYRARTDTKMAVAAERLAVIAALTLPVTAISSVLGMNVIVNDSTRWGELLILLALMTAMSLWLLRWARRQGWW